MPIEIVASHLLGKLLDDYTLLIVDKFVELNGFQKEKIYDGQQKLERILRACDRVFGPTRRIKTSDFMSSSNYLDIYQEIRNIVINNPALLTLTRESLPKRYRFLKESFEYPIHEYACVRFLVDNDYRIKIGPRSEQVYDRVIKELVPIGFAYVPVTYALNTRKLKPVVPYIASSNGLDPKKHRILIGNEGIEEAKEKIKNSRMTTLKFYDGLSHIAFDILNGKIPPNLSEMMKTDPAHYKHTIAEMIGEYVLKPLQGELS